MNDSKLENSVWLRKGNYTAYYTNGENLVSFDEAEILCRKLPELKMFMHDSGIACTHNIPCGVCKTNHAVFNTSLGVTEPCWDCRKEGWSLQKSTPSRELNWFQKYVLGMK